MSTTLYGKQLSAARALAGVSKRIIADAAGVAPEVIRRLEDRNRAIVLRETPEAQCLKEALEQYGVCFIYDDANGGAGVRLKYNRAEVARIARFENEGGPVGEDDV